jgi:hypothetical protein
MIIGLHDAEKEHMPKKTFPNYALMKISAYHKSRGDTVEFMPLECDYKKYDLIYSSKVFDFTPTNPYLPPEKTVYGGTGYGLYGELPPEIDAVYPDYSVYPQCDYAIGFLTRGCIRSCDWCVVPKKEGKIRPYRTVAGIARPDTDKIVFMDNNFLAYCGNIAILEELAESRYYIDFNQGLDIRLLTPRHVEIFSRIKWIKYIRFSCDAESQVPFFEKAMSWFGEYGLKSRIFIYLLVKNNVAEAERRVRALHKINKGFHFYAQAECNIGKEITPAQLEFSHRYVYGRLYYKENWRDYCEKRGFDYAS